MAEEGAHFNASDINFNVSNNNLGESIFFLLIMNYERFEAATDFKVFDLLIFFSSASFLFVFLLAERE